MRIPPMVDRVENFRIAIAADHENELVLFELGPNGYGLEPDVAREIGAVLLKCAREVEQHSRRSTRARGRTDAR